MVDYPFHGFDAPRIPGPRFGCDIPVDFNAQGMGKFCQRQVESGIVYEDNFIGLLAFDIDLGLFHEALYFLEIFEHFHQSHDVAVAVVRQ